MNCQEVTNKLCDYSADAVASNEAHEIESHLEKCPPCLQHWNELQSTLFSVSTAVQPVPHCDCSRQMWSHCLSHIEKKVEQERLQTSRKASWFQSPWLGWATLGGAFAFLGFVWLSNPQQVTQPDSVNITIIATNPNLESEWTSFDTPPRAATSYINHHAMMAFDPFVDRVGTSLVADSAVETDVVRVSSINVANGAFSDMNH